MTTGAKKLPASFYERPTLEVASALLGKVLVRETPEGRASGRIVETEAYVGPEDRASHAFRGPTRRNAAMFGPAGRAYVYQIYGLHFCLNAVTEAEGYPAAVLVRALEPVAGVGVMRLRRPGIADRDLARGPGRLCRALAIDRAQDGEDLAGNELWIEDGDPLPPGDIVATPRIGVDFAGEWSRRPWRFRVAGSRFVSRR